MARFSETGADMYICQVCGLDLDSEKYPPVWRPDITGHENAGNVCPDCLERSKWKNTIEWLRDLKSRAMGEGDGPKSLELHRLALGIELRLAVLGPTAAFIVSEYKRMKG